MTLRHLVVFILLTTLAACNRGRQYEMRGQVLGVNREKAELLVPEVLTRHARELLADPTREIATISIGLRCGSD